MNIVHIIPNEKDISTWTTKQVENVLDYLLEEFQGFPKNARIYHGGYAVANDVTPAPTFVDIERFKQLEGTFYVVIKPSLEPATIIAIVSAVVSGLSVLATFLMMPKAQKQQQESPNNSLNARQNIARIKGRIPEIFGTVRSYPDLIAETYTYFNTDGVEVERSLLCIGNGFYSILDVKDATTRVSDIAGTSVSVYDPGVDIRTIPVWRSGKTFTDLPFEVVKSRSITGQSLDSPEDALIETNKVYFTSNGEIKRRDTTIDFTTLGIMADETLIISGAVLNDITSNFSGAVTLFTDKTLAFTTGDIKDFDKYRSINLTGFNTTIKEWLNLGDTPSQFNRSVNMSAEYRVSNITRTAAGANAWTYVAELINPEDQNQSWINFVDPTLENTSKTDTSSTVTLKNNLNSVSMDGSYVVTSISADTIKLDTTFPNIDVSTQSYSPTVVLEKLSSKYVGWHDLLMDDAEEAVFNFHFPQGLYRQNSKGGVSNDWTSYKLEYQVLGSDGVPMGAVMEIVQRIDGKTKASFGKTARIPLPAGNSGIRFRLSRSRSDIANNVIAQMNIKDVYLCKQSTIASYPGVTVVQSEAVGGDGLYAITDRKLNMLVQRRLPQDGTGPLIATNRADQTLIYTALEKQIGRRSIGEVDVAQIKSEIAAVESYFGNSKAVEFCATLDDPKLSFEETASMIASAAFCEATRFGNQLRLYFEKPQTTARLLFNHRNKVPRSEKRTYTTSIDNEYDGVEIEYTDPKDDARVTYTAPENTAVTNPLKIESTGIRNAEQAKTRAWREWNKMRYRRVDIEFEALDEANILVRNNMIMVADNTREKTQDGQVIKAEGLKLTLSQDVDFSGQASIYLQMPSGMVDVIGCPLGEYSNEVILNRTPLYPVVTESDRYVKTAYQVVKASEKTQMFLLASADPVTQMTQKLTAYKYDARYYSADHQFF